MKTPSLPILYTPRFVLRPLNQEHMPLVRQMDTDPDMMRYLNKGLTKTMEESRQWMAHYLAYMEANPTLGIWMAFARLGDRFAGLVALKHMKPQPNDVEVGYRVHRPYWGKGVATEMALAAVNYGFDTLSLPRILAAALPQNKASIKVMEKLGMRLLKYDYYEPNTEMAFYVLEPPAGAKS